MEILMILLLTVLTVPVAYMVINQSIKDFFGRSGNNNFRKLSKYDILDKYNNISRLARK